MTVDQAVCEILARYGVEYVIGMRLYLDLDTKRTRIINILGNRKDQESTDKLIDIVKNSTVINHRMQAINALQAKKDPRATQALMDILDGKKA